MYQPSNIRHIQQRLEWYLGPSYMPTSHSGNLWLENFATQERSVVPRGPLSYLAMAFLHRIINPSNLRDM